MNSAYGTYEQILKEFISLFVDKDKSGFPLVYRGKAPQMKVVEAWGEPKVFAVYTVFEGDYGQQTVQPVSLYVYKDRDILAFRKEQMREALQNNAVIVHGDGIKVKFTSGNPFIQDKVDEDENIKGYYINMLATIY